MANTRARRINNYEVYLDGTRLLGTVSAELPNPQFITQETKGAGISGSLDVPVVGNIQNMTAKLTWHVAMDEIRELLVQKYHHIELWSSIESIDPATGEFINTQQKVVLRACPLGVNLGQLAPADLQNVEMDFNVSYMKWVIGNNEYCEIDPFNMIYRVYGQDFLSQVRGNLGL